MKNFFLNIWKYLKDWKNLLGHTLLGITIIVVSAILPIPWWARVIVLVVLVVFNIFRERLFATIFRKKRSVSEKDKTTVE
jgi:thiol:disulfide interchange protein